MYATGLIVAVVGILAATLPLVSLAKAASLAILVVFATVDLALVIIKLREPGRAADSFTVPLGVPLLGFLASGGIVAFEMGRLITGFGGL